jgi:hypothetical protein
MPLRTRLFRGIALLAALVVFALLASRIAWPQQPAPQPAPQPSYQPAPQPAYQPAPQPAPQPAQYTGPRVFPGVGEEAVYTSAGVGELGSSASVAWFIATPAKGDAYPIACKFAGESFTCKKGTFQ